MGSQGATKVPNSTYRLADDGSLAIYMSTVARVNLSGDRDST